MTSLVALVRRYGHWLLVGLVALVSAITWYVLYQDQLTLVYNDAKSYLNISRAVFDSRQPGLPQIGSVWLPFTHILKLPLIWNDWAWHSGFAGALISMASYVLTVIGVYKITFQLTQRRLAALVAGLATALNVNFLYLQTTPLTEPLYLALLVWSVYFLVKYLQTSQLKYLLPLALLVVLQMLTRYDGWFVAAVLVSIVFFLEWRVRRLQAGQAFGQVLLVAVPAAFAAVLWVGWNALIFGDPLYFAAGPNSARAQQGVIESSSGLITKGDVGMSIEAYGYAVAANIGWVVLGLALIGWLAYALFRQGGRHRFVGLTVLGILFAVFVFNVLALVMGFSVINVPQLGWDTAADRLALFNVRYGLLLLPLAAVGVGLLVARWRVAAIAVVALVVLQNGILLRDKPITLQDGQAGASAFVQHDLARQLERRVRPQDEVLLSLAVFNPVTFESGLQLNQIIHEGVQKEWDTTLDRPQRTAEWILVGANAADPVYAALHDTNTLREHYRQVYTDRYGTLYQLRK